MTIERNPKMFGMSLLDRINAGTLRIGRPETGPKVPTYAGHRRCECGARLSIYNPDANCAPCARREAIAKLG